MNKSGTKTLVSHMQVQNPHYNLPHLLHHKYPCRKIKHILALSASYRMHILRNPSLLSGLSFRTRIHCISDLYLPLLLSTSPVPGSPYMLPAYLPHHQIFYLLLLHTGHLFGFRAGLNSASSPDSTELDNFRFLPQNTSIPYRMSRSPEMYSSLRLSVHSLLFLHLNNLIH